MIRIRTEVSADEKYNILRPNRKEMRRVFQRKTLLRVETVGSRGTRGLYGRRRASNAL